MHSLQRDWQGALPLRGHNLACWCPLPAPGGLDHCHAAVLLEIAKDGSEPDLAEIAYMEEWAKGLVYCEMDGFAIFEDGSLVLLDECGNWRCPPAGRFVVKWSEG